MKCQIPQISWHGRDPVLSVDFQVVDGNIRRLATGGTDSHVIIWYVSICPKGTIGLECACDLSRHNKSVNVVRFSPNGEILASGDDEGGILLWKLRETNQSELDSDSYKEDWAPIRLLRGHLDDICDLCWSPNSNFIVSGSIDNCLLVWDIQKGQHIRVAKDAKGFVQGVTWDPQNHSFASISSDRMLRVYSVTSKKLMHRVYKAPSVDSGEKSLNKPKRLFHDDTLQSFCRRLTFSPDGNLLFVPSGIKEKDEKMCHTTYAFSRHEFKTPLFHLPSGQKYTVAVRCCPKLFKLREIKGPKQPTPMIKLPYRMMFAIATQDSIFLYDTQQHPPFAYVSNIHYAHLTDLSWSSDGQLLIASSTDGYCSFVIFSEGELGEVYVPEVKEPNVVSESQLNCIENIGPKVVEERPKSPSPSDKENISIVPSPDTIKELEPSKKSKTPKQSSSPSVSKPSSAKKCSTNIMNFFSPPSKKLKISNKSDTENSSLGDKGKPLDNLSSDEGISPMETDCNIIRKDEEMAVKNNAAGNESTKTVSVVVEDDDVQILENACSEKPAVMVVNAALQEQLPKISESKKKSEQQPLGSLSPKHPDEGISPMETDCNVVGKDSETAVKINAGCSKSIKKTSVVVEDDDSIQIIEDTCSKTPVVATVNADLQNQLTKEDPESKVKDVTSSSTAPSSTQKPKRRIQFVTLSDKVSSKQNPKND